MAYNEILANKIRQALADLPDVEEKKMFGGIAFMVGGKMCLTAGSDRMMCRFDPYIHEKIIQQPGCRTVIMNGRKYKGYVYINETFLQSKSDLNYWVTLALDFNKKVLDKRKKRNPKN